MHSITKDFWFSASHRIEGHPKCGRLHGHNYKVTIRLTGLINDKGWVEDFGIIKMSVKPIIDALDHYTLFSSSNISAEPELYELCSRKGWALTLPVNHTTAEELARYLHRQICEALRVLPNKLVVSVEETQESHSTAIYEG